ncbi:MAG: efflux RND transporter periplasmic adaptor subunit [Bacteroidota bacterium]
MTTKRTPGLTRTLKKSIIPFFLLVMAVVLVSCNGGENKTEPEIIREQISNYNEQVVELNQKIAKLERDLEELGEVTQNRQRTPITVSTLEAAPFDHYFRVNASVEAVQEAMISPEANGQITEISVVKGQQVRRGQVLARLNTAVIESNIAEVKTSLDLAETVYSRQKRLWDQQIGSEIQYLEAKNSYESLKSRLKTLESQLDMAIVEAPFDGIVDEIFAKEGELAMPGMNIMQLINLNELFVNADVSETFLPEVNSNDWVILRFPAYPDYEQKVPVYRIGNTINPENRTFRLRLKIENPGQRIKPNMLAGVSINTFSTDSALVVPSIYIKQDVQGYFLFLAAENEQGELVAEKTYVERGLSGEGQTMITSGVKPGDRIIRQGHNMVSDGTLVKISEEQNLARNN